MLVSHPPHSQHESDRLYKPNGDRDGTSARQRKVSGDETNLYKGGDLVIQPGMVFELEPCPARGNHMVTLGGTVIATRDGVEELNILSTEVNVTG